MELVLGRALSKAKVGTEGPDFDLEMCFQMRALWDPRTNRKARVSAVPPALSPAL